MRIIRAFVVMMAALALTIVALVATPASASAPTGGCYGAGCNGLNPQGRCDGDAVTVATKEVTDGMLHLRYSPSCKANWGRYMPYTRDAILFTVSSDVTFARVTVWNPGEKSYGLAHADLHLAQGGTSWSQMTDGTKTACTGVETIVGGRWVSGVGTPQPPIDWEEKIWNWGPCY